MFTLQPKLKMKTGNIRLFFVAAALALGMQAGLARTEPITVAVFDFGYTGSNFREIAPKLTSLITANLTAYPEIAVVERAELKKTLSEQEFGLGGSVSSETAAKIG